MLIKFNAYLFAFVRNACEDAIYGIVNRMYQTKEMEFVADEQKSMKFKNYFVLFCEQLNRSERIDYS